MRVLSAPFDPAAPRLPAWPAVGMGHLAAASIALLTLGLAVEGLARWKAPGRALQIAAVHGGLVAGGFLLLDPRDWRRPGLTVASTMLGAAWLAQEATWGWMAWALPPAVLGWQVRRVSDARPGPWHARRLATGPASRGWWCTPPRRAREAVAGLAVGGLLGAHLLLTAAMTFGYVVGAGPAGTYVAALAYDLGANALTAAWFIHGALFSWLWRRLEFWRATFLATTASLVRYLLDPALPRAAEAAAGAVFYLVVLGIAACALRARTGNAVAAYAATAGFFAAYRALSGW